MHPEIVWFYAEILGPKADRSQKNMGFGLWAIILPTFEGLGRAHGMVSGAEF